MITSVTLFCSVLVNHKKTRKGTNFVCGVWNCRHHLVINLSMAPFVLLHNLHLLLLGNCCDQSFQFFQRKLFFFCQYFVLWVIMNPAGSFRTEKSLILMRDWNIQQYHHSPTFFWQKLKVDPRGPIKLFDVSINVYTEPRKD